MIRSGRYLVKHCIVWVVALLLFCVSFGAAGCSHVKTSGNPSVTTDRTIWRSGQQNVRIEHQDTKNNEPNDHPIMLAPDQIRRALASLEVRLKRKDRPVPVFTDPELDLLAKHLSDGIAQAGPNEDVTFAVVGQRRALYGFAKERKATTGRAFYREGKLNIIFARMIDDIGQYDDTSAKPMFLVKSLTPGSRSKPVEHSWYLEIGPDMQFYTGGDTARTDWVLLDLASMAAHEAMGIKPATTGKITSERPSSVSENLTSPQETRQVPAPAYQPPAATHVPQAGNVNKTVEERLTILNNLKNKNLITEEEYKAKRAAILNDL